jgi:hypothetical protein
MDNMRSIAPAGRKLLAPLFTDHRHLRPDVDAVLQGHCGTVLANTGSDVQVAQLSLSVLTFFGGDATHPIARRLVEQVSGETIVLVASEAWRALVRHVHGAWVIAQPRVAFSATPLELGHLRQLSAAVPAGYQVTPIDLTLAQRLGSDVSAGLILPEVWPSLEDFVARGVGFCARGGERIVCAATSAARSEHAIEIQINTIPSSPPADASDWLRRSAPRWSRTVWNMVWSRTGIPPRTTCHRSAWPSGWAMYLRVLMSGWSCPRKQGTKAAEGVTRSRKPWVVSGALTGRDTVHNRTEPSAAPDCLQPTLVPRFGFRHQVSASVRRQKGNRELP